MLECPGALRNCLIACSKNISGNININISGNILLLSRLVSKHVICNPQFAKYNIHGIL